MASGQQALSALLASMSLGAAAGGRAASSGCDGATEAGGTRGSSRKEEQSQAPGKGGRRQQTRPQAVLHEGEGVHGELSREAYVGVVARYDAQPETALCACGTGRKYIICCRRKHRERAVEEAVFNAERPLIFRQVQGARCACGTGKLYQNCCRRVHNRATTGEGAPQAQTAPPAPLPSSPPPPPPPPPPEASPEMQAFAASRAAVLKQHGFLRYDSLLENLHRRLGARRRWGDQVSELMQGAKRLLSGVESCVQGLGVCNVFTLHDFQEHVLCRLRELKELRCFEDAGIGKLVNHPGIRRLFNLPKDGVAFVPHLTTAELIEALYRVNYSELHEARAHLICDNPGIDASSLTSDMRVEKALEKLAEAHAVPSARHLCVYVRAAGFVHMLTHLCKKVERRARSDFERVARKQAAEGIAAAEAAKAEAAAAEAAQDGAVADDVRANTDVDDAPGESHAPCESSAPDTPDAPEPVSKVSLVDHVQALLVDALAQTDGESGPASALLAMAECERRLCEERQCDAFAELGHGSFSEFVAMNSGVYMPLLRLCADPASGLEDITEENAPRNDSIVSAAALVDDGESDADDYGDAASTMGDKEALLRTLEQVPHLCDAAEWTRWDVRVNGTFGSFIREHRLTLAERGVAFMGDGAGCFHALPSAPTLEAFEYGVRSADPLATAAQLTGACVAAGAVSGAPLDLFARVVRAQLSTMSSLHAARFVVAGLALLPGPLARSRAAELALARPANDALGDPDLLVRACVGAHETAVLRALGRRMGILAWADALPPQGASRGDIEDVPSLSEDTPKHDGNVALAAQLASPRGGLAGAALGGTPEGSDPPQAEDPRADASGMATSELVARIRVKFGLDTLLEEEGPVRQLHALATRSLKRLSAELYSEEVHFLLELMQNCDDSTYAAGVTPTMTVALAGARLTLSSNEVGFTEADAEALCNVAASTKVRAGGFIGCKGIGFKSVFKISDMPQVHSRWLNIAFDARDEAGLGYICPHAVPIPTDISPHGTSVVLPLRDASKAATRELRSKLAALDPILLLFLRKLRILCVDLDDGAPAVTMERRDLGNGVVELVTSGGMGAQRVQQYLVSSTCSVPPAAVAAGRHGAAGVASELVCALPLLCHAELTERGLPQQKVCAFLPTRSYGWKFLLQGDFETSSSREALTGASPWNQWLRERLPSCFVALARAISARARRLVDLGDLEEAAHSVSLLLAATPCKGSAQDFFSKSPSSILRCLASEPFLLAQDGDMVTPARALLRPPHPSAAEAAARFLHPQGLRLVHEAVLLPRDLAAAIGVRGWDDGALVAELIAAAARAFEANGCIADEREFAWIAWALGALESSGVASKHAAQLSSLAFVPTAGGAVGAPAGGAAIFDAGGGLTGDAGRQPPALLGSACLLHPAMSRACAQEAGAVPMLRRLGVAATDGRSFCLTRIVPALASVDASPAELVDALVYAKACCIRDRSSASLSLAELGSALASAGARVVLDGVDERAAVLGKNAVTKPRLGDSLGGEKRDALVPPPLLGDVWPVLSSGYVAADADKGGWRELFASAGVSDVFATTEELLCVVECINAAALSDTDSGYDAEKHGTALQRHLANGWNSYYHTIFLTDCRLVCRLREARWVPVQGGGLDCASALVLAPSRGPARSRAETELHAAGLVRYARRAAGESSIAEELLQVLGASARVTPAQIVPLLTASAQGGTLSTKLSVLALAYENAASDPSVAKQVALSTSTPFVFVPDEPPVLDARTGKRSAPTCAAPGRLLPALMCAREDPSGLIDSVRHANVSGAMVALANCAAGVRVLGGFYQGPALAALGSLGCPARPPFAAYASIVAAAAAEVPTTPDCCAAAFRVLCHWGHDLSGSDDQDYEGNCGRVANGVATRTTVELVRAALTASPGILNALGEWCRLEDIAFFDDRYAPGYLGAAAIERLRARCPWLEHCAAGGMYGVNDTADTRDGVKRMRLTGKIVVKDLHANLKRFYREIGLPALSTCQRQYADVPDGAVEATPPRACVAALLFLQRWTAAQVDEGALNAAQRSAAAAAVARLSFREVRGSLRRGVEITAAGRTWRGRTEPLQAPYVLDLSDRGEGGGATLFWQQNHEEDAVAASQDLALLIFPEGGDGRRAAERALIAFLSRLPAGSCASAAATFALDETVEAQVNAETPWCTAKYVAAPSGGFEIAHSLLLSAATATSEDAVQPVSDGTASESNHANAILSGAAAAVSELRARPLKGQRRAGGVSADFGSGVSLSSSARAAAGNDETPGAAGGKASSVVVSSAPSARGGITCDGDGAAAELGQSIETGANAGVVRLTESLFPSAPEATPSSSAPSIWATRPPPGDAFPVRMLPSVVDDGDAHAVGRWGEHFVYQLLQREVAGSGSGARVTWLNEEGESGKAWDIEVGAVKGKAPSKGGRPGCKRERARRVEVKSQSAPLAEGACVGLTRGELAAMHQSEAVYELWHVGGVRSGKPGVRVLRDPAAALARGDVRLMLG